MLKKERKLLSEHKSVETTKSIVELVTDVEDHRIKKIVIVLSDGSNKVWRVGKLTKNKDVKKWLKGHLNDTVAIELYHRNHMTGGLKDTYHRLGGTDNLWTLFLWFKNNEII